MILAELLTNAYQFKNISASMYSFNTPKSIVHVHFFKDESKQIYWLEFTRDYDSSITGTGDAYKIFATVLKILAKFIAEVKPPIICATSTPGGGRTSLYKKLFASLLQKHTDYVELKSRDQLKDDQMRNTFRKDVATVLGDYSEDPASITLFAAVRKELVSER